MEFFEQETIQNTDEDSKKKKGKTGSDIVMTEYGEAHNFIVSQHTQPKNLATAVLLCLNDGNKVRLAATGNALRIMLKALPVIEKHKPVGYDVIYVPGTEFILSNENKCTIVHFTIFLVKHEDSPMTKLAKEENESSNKDKEENLNDDLLIVDVLNNKHLIKETIKYYHEKGFTPTSSTPIVSKGNTSYIILTFKKNTK